MAVANFHYITRMSSGFKVYILEGQPHLRSEDRYRHITNDRVRSPTLYPVKRKRSHERALTLEERRERVLNRNHPGAAQTSVPRLQSPSSSWSSAPSPPSPPPSHVYYTPVMDEPLALIKKPRKEPEHTGERSISSTTTTTTTTTPVQVRPSVITCVSSIRRPEVHRSHSSVVSQSSYDNVEEHFQRSLGADYQKTHSQQLSISVSVDDHFAKALGDKWLQIKSKSSSCSSTPPSSHTVTHSPSHSHSSAESHKESSSRSSPSSSCWSIH
ncbi:vestigial like 4 like [Cynoglossus semilaevis]|uniref:Vestigial like 4 like n=1 Tax=Cynoglossus semilaevis TaxID=244447 RepID=A0A3P8WUR6_CYNSE|nr:transcription cofactor vestigial-like protein 4 [Cynoglossus semilaevis]